MLYLIAYDIAGDRRREDVATVLSGYGPRVQLSVFECGLRSRREATALRAKLRTLIDAVEDQVRIYPLGRKDGPWCRGPGSAGDRGTPGLLDRLVTRYTDTTARLIGPRLAHGNAQVSGRFRGTGPETLAGAAGSGEDGATDTKRPGHSYAGKASVTKPSPTSRA